MLAPCGLNLHFYSFFHGPCAKKIININTKTRKIWMIVLSTRTPIKHHNNTPSMENLNPKCDKNKYKKCQILKLQYENETKNKNLCMQIISIQYWCLFQTSKYLMHIAKNCLHYPSLKNLDFLKQYNYLQLYIHLYG
jgi:hypothetical protein